MKAAGRLLRRYGRALFEAASEERAVAAVAADLARLREAFGDGGFAALLLDPSRDRAEKKARLEERARPASPLVGRFLALALERRREGILPALAAAFDAEADRAAGIVRGTLTSARPVPEEERLGFERALGASLGSKVALAVEVDPGLVGGVRIDVAGARLDATVPGRLAALREGLLAAPLPQS